MAVFCPPDAPGGKIDPVKQLALGLTIPVYQHKSLKAPEVQAEFADLKTDLAILAFVTRIVPLEVINTPRLGSICFHPSLLPKYRGGSAINWTLIKGETKTGITLFWTDAGIDTGPILLQKEVEISPLIRVQLMAGTNDYQDADGVRKERGVGGVRLYAG